MHPISDNFTCGTLMYTIGSSILIASICRGKSIKKMANLFFFYFQNNIPQGKQFLAEASIYLYTIV